MIYFLTIFYFIPTAVVFIDASIGNYRYYQRTGLITIGDFVLSVILVFMPAINFVIFFTIIRRLCSLISCSWINDFMEKPLIKKKEVK